MNGLDDEFNQWKEDIKSPDYRRKIWEMLAFTCAFVGDSFKANYYLTLAEREKAGN
jgi:hypothetical protein